MAAAAQYETSATFREAWQRISATQLRKKLVKTWSRKYVGIPGEQEASSLLEEIISTYANINEGTISIGSGGMWEADVTFKTAEWVSPSVIIEG